MPLESKATIDLDEPTDHPDVQNPVAWDLPTDQSCHDDLLAFITPIISEDLEDLYEETLIEPTAQMTRARPERKHDRRRRPAREQGRVADPPADSGGRGAGAFICRLTEKQLAAIRTAMHLFVEDDISRGLTPEKRLACDACQCVQQAAGFIQYGHYLVCNDCATEYEIGRASGVEISAGQYVRAKRFGETGAFALQTI